MWHRWTPGVWITRAVGSHKSQRSARRVHTSSTEVPAERGVGCQPPLQSFRCWEPCIIWMQIPRGWGDTLLFTQRQMKDLLEHARQRRGAWPTQLSGSCRTGWLCGRGQPVCRGERCWHLLQTDSARSSLFLILALSSKEVKNLWALFLKWHTEQSRLPAPKSKGMLRQCGFVSFEGCVPGSHPSETKTNMQSASGQKWKRQWVTAFPALDGLKI